MKDENIAPVRLISEQEFEQFQRLIRNEKIMRKAFEIMAADDRDTGPRRISRQALKECES